MGKTKKRKSPSDKANIFPLDHMKKGLDGNMWTVVEIKNGIKRWKKIKNPGTSCKNVSLKKERKLKKIKNPDTSDKKVSLKKIGKNTFKSVSLGSKKAQDFTIEKQPNSDINKIEFKILLEFKNFQFKEYIVKLDKSLLVERNNFAYKLDVKSHEKLTEMIINEIGYMPDNEKKKFTRESNREYDKIKKGLYLHFAF